MVISVSLYTWITDVMFAHFPQQMSIEMEVINNVVVKYNNLSHALTVL